MSFQALLLNDDIRHAINITRAPYLGLTSRTPIAWPHWRFPFSYDFYDRQALVLAWHDCDGSLFLQQEYPIKRFVIATLQDFLTGRLKGSFFLCT